MTTASAPRGSTPPVAIGVAVPGPTTDAGHDPRGELLVVEPRARRGASSDAPNVSSARTA